ncbi:MAG: PIN domain-containing protein [Campylobacterota bacterium]|nr:PIN domain-containing protein [Campylobacterota bacterium]
MSRIIYLDANILVDYIEPERARHNDAKQIIGFCLMQNYLLFTSCDVLTTIYYINRKKNRIGALENIESINKFVHVVEFSNREIAKTCQLMREDVRYEDLEDTLQYILAKKEQCNTIVSNDKSFVSKEIELLSSGAFIKKYISDND